jgi:hypothetical protein
LAFLPPLLFVYGIINFDCPDSQRGKFFPRYINGANFGLVDETAYLRKRNFARSYAR